MDKPFPPGLVAVPMVDWMYSKAAVALLELSHNLPQGSTVTFNPRGSQINTKRNRIVEDFLANPTWRWLLFVDSDTVVPADTAFRLLRLDADIASGLVCKKHPDYTAVAGHVVQQADDPDPLRPGDNEVFRWRGLDLRKVGPEMGAVEVDVVGAAMLLIHRHVLEDLDPPYFPANERVGGLGEDINFSLRARNAGHRIVCDTELQGEHIGHHGMTVAKARGFWRDKVAREGGGK